MVIGLGNGNQQIYTLHNTVFTGFKCFPSKIYEIERFPPLLEHGTVRFKN